MDAGLRLPRLLSVVVVLALAAPAGAQEAPADRAPEVRTSPKLRRIRAAPEAQARTVGLIAQEAAFHVWAFAPPDKDCEEGWGRVAPDREAWTCLDGTLPSAETPHLLPYPFPFDPPLPTEEADYLASGTWPREPVATGEGLLPFVYAKRRRSLQGPIHPSLEDLLAGRNGKPVQFAHDLAFSKLLDVDGVEVVVAPDGRAARLDTLYVYAASRFVGVDLSTTPLPAGRVPAYSVARAPVELRAEPAADAMIVGTLPWRQLAWIDATAPATPGWLRIEDPNGLRPAAWMRDVGSLRRWRDAPPPEGLGAGWWIDIDLSQQLLAVREGAALRYLTLVSTGKDGHETVTGVFPMLDKAAWWDMRSLPASSDPYIVESVPWTMHFWPRYALHGAYWHDVFGHVVSHGCINLAPQDAAWIFAHVEPHLHEGWQIAYADDTDPGTVLRVRRGTGAVKDRRTGAIQR